MAQARKAAAKRGAARKAAKRGTVRKTVKKAARKVAKKATRKTAAAGRGRKTARTTRAAKRPTARKTVRKAARKTVRKAAPAPLNPVTWFEIPVRDMPRAMAFYNHVLQTQISLQDMGTFKMGWFTGSPDGRGAAGTLMLSEGYTPSQAGTLVYFEVQDIEACLRRAQERGGRVVNPKMSVGEYGFVGHFEDCEGNRVGLHSMA
jgi:predicted enzyme related to lactoylglutathione lyase